MSIKQLRQLYKEIPSFSCLLGCTGCCGPIPFTSSEWSRVRDKKKASGIDCPYSLQGRCDIYDERPFICRLFGASEDLKCPRGCRPDKPLSVEKTRQLMRKYRKISETEGEIVLLVNTASGCGDRPEYIKSIKDEQT